MQPLELLEELRSPTGHALLGELSHESIEERDAIGVITRLRARYSQTLIAAAIDQVRLRAKAHAKFTRADEMFFTRAGLEQASSERMAAHHASRYRDFDEVFDLCCGIGGDLIGLAAAGRRAVGVDRDPLHARIAKLNAEASGVGDRADVVCADVHDIPLEAGTAAFIDPARRGGEGRFRVGESEPSLDWCVGLATRGVHVGVKAAPGLPMDRTPDSWEVEFVSEHRELKECALWSPSLASAIRRATVLPSGDSLTELAGATLEVRSPGVYLLDPDPSITRAGLVETLGATLGECWKIDDRVAFLSSDRLLDSPFARTLRVQSSLPWNLKTLRAELSRLDVGTIDIRKRGSAVDVDEVQRKLKLRGSQAGSVVLTRVADRPWAFVCVAAGAK